jgi:hypothetical protein
MDVEKLIDINFCRLIEGNRMTSHVYIGREGST